MISLAGHSMSCLYVNVCESYKTVIEGWLLQLSSFGLKHGTRPATSPPVFLHSPRMPLVNAAYTNKTVNLQRYYLCSWACCKPDYIKYNTEQLSLNGSAPRSNSMS